MIFYQLWTGIVHFFVSLSTARYTDFCTASSLGKMVFPLVYLRVTWLRFSMILVVYIKRRISLGKSKKVESRSQFWVQLLKICGYFSPHISSTSIRASSAASLLLAWYIFFKSFATALRSPQVTYLSELRIWCTMQVCCRLSGYTALIASEKPLRLSVAAIKISFTPPLF